MTLGGFDVYENAFDPNAIHIFFSVSVCVCVCVCELLYMCVW